jgi:hypothetical protein
MSTSAFRSRLVRPDAGGALLSVPRVRRETQCEERVALQVPMLEHLRALVIHSTGRLATAVRLVVGAQRRSSPTMRASKLLVVEGLQQRWRRVMTVASGAGR